MRALERRIERLEGRAHVGGDVEKAYAILHAFDVVNQHPEEATEADRVLVASSSSGEWQRAFVVVIETEGGLEAVVRQAAALIDDQAGNPSASTSAKTMITADLQRCYRPLLANG